MVQKGYIIDSETDSLLSRQQLLPLSPTTSTQSLDRSHSRLSNGMVDYIATEREESISVIEVSMVVLRDRVMIQNKIPTEPQPIAGDPVDDDGEKSSQGVEVPHWVEVYQQ